MTFKLVKGHADLRIRTPASLLHLDTNKCFYYRSLQFRGTLHFTFCLCVCVFCRTFIVLGMHWESFGDALKVLSRSIRDALGLLFECV